MENKSLKNISNSYSTGGAGSRFEWKVGAVFLLAMVIDGFAPILGKTIEKIEFQAKKSGFNTDDIVVFCNTEANNAKILCQVKHTINAIKSDSSFKKSIENAWIDFNSNSFSKSDDRIVIITNDISMKTLKSFRKISEVAYGSSNSKQFFNTIKQQYTVSNDVREKLSLVASIVSIDIEKSTEIELNNFWMFFKCFGVFQFDLHTDNSINDVLIKTLINCKSDADAGDVWHSLFYYVGHYSEIGATITIDNVSSEIKDYFGLPISADINPSFSHDLLTDLFFIGGWNDDNDNDISIVEQLTEGKYKKFIHDIYAIADNNDVLIHRNGSWKTFNRKGIYAIIKNTLDKKTIQYIFDLTRSVICSTQTKKRISGIPVISSNQGYSGLLQKELLKGLCIIANSDAPKYIEKEYIERVSAQFIREIFLNMNKEMIESLGDYLSLLAEISPRIYLDCLSNWISNNSEAVLSLFPNQSDYYLCTSKSVFPVLFSIELLAWNSDLLYKCTRCLLELESLNYHRGNFANNPLNSLISIFNAYSPQTYASFEEMKNLILDIKNCSYSIFGKLINSLLIKPGTIIIPTNRPKYLNLIEIDEQQRDQRQTELVLFYNSLAVDYADKNPSMILDLVDDIDFMDKVSICKYLDNIINYAHSWSEKDSTKIWIKLSEKKNRIIVDNNGIAPRNKMMNKLNEAISVLSPQDIYYKYQLLYNCQMLVVDYKEKRYKKLLNEQRDSTYDLFEKKE